VIICLNENAVFPHFHESNYLNIHSLRATPEGAYIMIYFSSHTKFPMWNSAENNI